MLCALLFIHIIHVHHEVVCDMKERPMILIVATRLKTSQASGVSVPSQDHGGTHSVHNVYIQVFNHTALLIEIS